MGNQSLDSLGLISARYLMDSLSILRQLAAAHLVAAFQARFKRFPFKILLGLGAGVQIIFGMRPADL